MRALYRPRPSVISLARYTDLLGRSELRSAIFASVLGRLPIGITGLAVLLLGQEATGSYGRGGVLAGCYVAGLAAFAPLLGRLIDRQGPRWLLLACAFVSCGASRACCFPES